MELFLNCKIPEIYEANIIKAIIRKKKYNLLLFFPANIYNMRVTSTIICMKYSYTDTSNIYIPSYNFLSELNFENLYEFFNFAVQLYQENIKILFNFCCEFKKKKYPNKELIEKWVIDGHKPCYRCNSMEYYALFYDYIFQHYDKKFSDSFRDIGYIRNNINYSFNNNEYCIKRFAGYVDTKKIDVDSLYLNKYIPRELYESYLEYSSYFATEDDSDDDIPDFLVDKEVKYNIECVFTNGKTCTLILPDNHIIMRNADNHYMFKLCNNIWFSLYNSLVLQPLCNCCNSYKLVEKVISVNNQTLLELKEYIITTEDNGSNFIVINAAKHLNNINLTNNTIIYYLDANDNYIDISEYYDIIKILSENNELNYVIDLLNGDYIIFNEPWFIEKLKCTVEPSYEIINIYNSIESDKLKYQFIKLILF